MLSLLAGAQQPLGMEGDPLADERSSDHLVHCCLLLRCGHRLRLLPPLPQEQDRELFRPFPPCEVSKKLDNSVVLRTNLSRFLIKLENDRQ